MVLFIGCGKEEVTFNEEKLKVIAKAQVADMINGNFSSTVQSFDAKIAKQLSENDMTNAWDTTVASLGNYGGHISLEGSLKKEIFTVVIIEEYENNGLKVTISYDQEYKIAGIFLNYAPITKDLEVNESFEEIPVTIGEELPLDGILTLPTSVEKPPVVLMIHGSGALDRNSTFYGNTPFQDIAHTLGEAGIASLRYDKRFFTYPEQASLLGVDVTLEDEVLQDVQLALDFLMEDARVNSDAIFVLGHSLGGGLTPFIAVNNKEVKGIISMAGSLRPLYELSYDQNKKIEENILKGDDEEMIDILKMQMQQVEEDMLILQGELDDMENDTILMGLPAGYQKSNQKFAGENYIQNVEVPILVLQGADDMQVFADKDFHLWEEALLDKENAYLKLYEGLNHFMMPSYGNQDMSEYTIKGVVDEKVLEDIIYFIKEFHQY